jgi:hypothetical protein
VELTTTIELVRTCCRGRRFGEAFGEDVGFDPTISGGESGASGALTPSSPGLEDIVWDVYYGEICYGVGFSLGSTHVCWHAPQDFYVSMQ